MAQVTYLYIVEVSSIGFNMAPMRHTATAIFQLNGTIARKRNFRQNCDERSLSEQVAGHTGQISCLYM